MFHQNEKPERGYVRMFLWNENRNEGTFAKTTLLRNRPFVSQRFLKLGEPGRYQVCLVTTFPCWGWAALILSSGWSRAECTKVSHRRSLAIFTADEGIAGNSAARTILTHSLRRRYRGSLAIFFAEKIAHLGALKNRTCFGGVVKITSRDFGALIKQCLTGCPRRGCNS